MKLLSLFVIVLAFISCKARKSVTDSSAKSGTGSAREYLPEGMTFIPVGNLYVSQTEVTWDQWDLLGQVSTGGSYCNPIGVAGSMPATCMSAKEASAYATDLSARNLSYRYRLPTDAEWSQIAAATVSTSTQGTNCNGSAPRAVNKSGALDGLIGNVAEWTSSEDSCNSDDCFINRGGSFRSMSCDKNSRASGEVRGGRSASVGFRLVRESASTPLTVEEGLSGKIRSIEVYFPYSNMGGFDRNLVGGTTATILDGSELNIFKATTDSANIAMEIEAKMRASWKLPGDYKVCYKYERRTFPTDGRNCLNEKSYSSAHVVGVRIWTDRTMMFPSGPGGFSCFIGFDGKAGTPCFGSTRNDLLKQELKEVFGEQFAREYAH